MKHFVLQNPKIYHIVHLDRLISILKEGCLWSDHTVQSKGLGGTMIGMSHIKERRMKQGLGTQAGLTVGKCVPFYFCPRSVMLFIISKQQHEDITFRGGQEPIIHLQSDLKKVVLWARENNKRWAFTDSNAGSRYFNDYCSWSDLDKIDWVAICSRDWSQHKEKKQAEFLLEDQLPWSLVECIGVYSMAQYQEVMVALKPLTCQPTVSIKSDWYY